VQYKAFGFLHERVNNRLIQPPTSSSPHSHTPLRTFFLARHTQLCQTNTSTMVSVKKAIAISASEQETLTSFTPFPKLPLELRLKIFKHALPLGPQGFRVLKVVSNTLVTTTHSTTTQVVGTTIKSSQQRKKRKSRSEQKMEKRSSYFLGFHLLDHKHSVYVRDVAMLRACSEYVLPHLE